jgi:hypothetical protein
MRRLVAIALVAGSAASSQAQRVASLGAAAHLVTLDSTMAPLPPPNRVFVLRPSMKMPSQIALSLPSASPANINDGRHGRVWKWVALGALVGAAVGGSVETNDTDRAEYAVPLAVVLGGVGGGLVGALALRLSW